MVTRQMHYNISAVGYSDIGKVRQNNEDHWTELPEVGVYILADGMGGHQAGEVAARETVAILSRVLRKKLKLLDQALYLSDAKELLRRAIRHANSLVFKMSRLQIELKGMGTTLCCLLFHRDGVLFAHVGDSRIYQLRNKKLKQLTKDHSLLCELVDQGHINEHQANDFLYKNIITKAIGTEPKIEPSIDFLTLEPEDAFLMCSDGLSDMLTLEEIQSIMNSTTSIHEAAKELIDEANRKGGKDNITVLIAKVKGPNERENIS